MIQHQQWVQVDQSHAELVGAIDRETVPHLWQYIQSLPVSQPHLSCSLQRVERLDSAGMAMLLHVIEHAKNQNCHIMLHSVPEQLKTLFKISNVMSMVETHIANE